MNYTAEYVLKQNGVSKSLLFIEETLKSFRVKKRDLLEALLISEETLLLLSEHAPENAGIKVTITRWMGVPRIRLAVPGSPVMLDEHLGTVSIDQLGEETENAIRSVMLRSYADSIKYRHRRSENILTIVPGIPERILATRTVAAIILSFLTALLLRQMAPDTVVQWISINLLDPVENLFISALMCMLGHAFPIYYGFKGGKCVATFAGALLVLNPLVWILLLLTFVLIVYISRYVSLGSVICAAAFPILSNIMPWITVAMPDGSFVGVPPAGIIAAVLMGVLIIVLHRQNIVRLWQ